MRAVKFGFDMAQGFAVEIVSQVVLHRDAPMTGAPTVGGAAGSLAAKKLKNHYLNPGPAMPTRLTVPRMITRPPASNATPSGDGGGWSTPAIIAGLVAAAAVIGGGVYYMKYMRKAQNEGIRTQETRYNELIGAIIADPQKMRAFKSALYAEFAKAGVEKRETGKLVAQIVGEVRQQAAMDDSIPVDTAALVAEL